MTAPRWATVKMAATEIGVSDHTVWRWIRQAHEAQVPRQTMRQHDDRGRFVKVTIVEMNALYVFEKSIGERKKPVGKINDTPNRL